MKKTHPAYGRRNSEITSEEIEDWSEQEYQEYNEWRVQVNLDYLVAEGMVEKFVDDSGEILYKMIEEDPFDVDL
jgi:Fe2+ or Zn2+ uptake regulation protein